MAWQKDSIYRPGDVKAFISFTKEKSDYVQFAECGARRLFQYENKGDSLVFLTTIDAQDKPHYIIVQHHKKGEISYVSLTQQHFFDLICLYLACAEADDADGMRAFDDELSAIYG